MPFNHFDHIAGIYGRASEATLSPEILQMLSLSPDMVVLDAGGGTGRVATALRARVKRVVIADPSWAMLKYAREKDLPVACTPAETLPFPPESFDRIIMVDAFHHVRDQILTARELWRVLRTDGRILMIEPDIHTFAARVVAFFETVLLMHSHILPYEKIEALFPRARKNSIRVNKNAIILAEKVRDL